MEKVRKEGFQERFSEIVYVSISFSEMLIGKQLTFDEETPESESEFKG